MKVLKSGFYKIDEIVGGFNSELVLIAARPAMGKTALAMSLAKNMAIEMDIPIALFSLEMSKQQLMNRLKSVVSGVNRMKINNDWLDATERALITEARFRIETAPLFLDDTPSLSISELNVKARRLVNEHGVKVIIIDYLQLMNASGMSYGSRQEEVSTISRSLKGLAKELNIPIIALSQLNRGVESREGAEGKKPQLSDLRESGAIEQDADMVCFIHRPEYYKIYEDDKGRDLRGLAQIIIAKHRNGAVGEVVLQFQGECGRFVNMEGHINPIILQKWRESKNEVIAACEKLLAINKS